MAYFLSNVCAKNYQNRFMYIRVIARQSSDIFGIQCMLNDYGETKSKLECGPMPNVLVALPNVGGALCSTPQSLADAHY